MKGMEKARSNDQWFWFLLLLLLIPLIGLAPRPHAARLEMERARRAAAFGSAEAAARHVAEAAGQMPHRTDMWELAASYALAAGEPERAIEYLTQAEAAAPEQLTANGLIVLGDGYEQIGDLRAALEAWQRAVKKAHTSAELYRRQERVHRALGEYDAAIGQLKTLVSLQPQDAGLHYQLGTLIATRDPEAALAHLVRAASLDAQFAEPVELIRRSVVSARLTDDRAYRLLAAGRALASLGEWRLAEEAFRQAALDSPQYAEAWAYLGEALQHNPTDEAVQVVGKVAPAARPEESRGYAELQRALELDPTSLAGHTFLSLFWVRQERFDLALQYIEQAVRLSPRNPILQAELGSIRALEGDLNAALRAYRRAVELAPSDPIYLRLLAEFSLGYEFEVRAVALPAARRAVLLEPNSPASLDLMAQALIKLEDLTNAERFLNRALRADPNYAPAYLHLGLLYLLQGDNQAALEKFDIVRTLQPNGPASDQAMRLLQMYWEH